jgi:hypothetical protein
LIFIGALRLGATAQARLAELQAALDALPSYPEQVAAAKSRWGSKPAALFVEVRNALAAQTSGNRRCHYCEDSMADEVEHVRPKDIYPGHTFKPGNYVFACGPCNGPKSNLFAVLVRRAGQPPRLVDVGGRKKDDPVVKPRAGTAALIDLQREDPLALLWLDFDTGRYVPDTDDEASEEALRASYTIKLLRLNERDDLVRGRRAAVSGFLSRLQRWVQEHQQWSAAEQQQFVDDFRVERYRGVWERMRANRAQLPQLDALLNQAPQALQW